jgi:hypothetical protein
MMMMMKTKSVCVRWIQSKMKESLTCYYFAFSLSLFALFLGRRLLLHCLIQKSHQIQQNFDYFSRFLHLDFFVA